MVKAHAFIYPLFPYKHSWCLSPVAQETFLLDELRQKSQLKSHPLQDLCWLVFIVNLRKPRFI